MSYKYADEVWAWFLERAQIHDVYTWDSAPEAALRHLKECGMDPAESSLPDLGTVSEFADTESPNAEVPAIVAERWRCNCGQYVSTYSYSPGNKWSHLWTLAIPGPYPLAQILEELLGD